MHVGKPVGARQELKDSLSAGPAMSGRFVGTVETESFEIRWYQPGRGGTLVSSIEGRVEGSSTSSEVKALLVPNPVSAVFLVVSLALWVVVLSGHATGAIHFLTAIALGMPTLLAFAYYPDAFEQRRILQEVIENLPREAGGLD